VSAHRVKAMFHSTAMVKDYDATVGRLAELFGLRVLEYGEATNPVVGRRGGMTWLGDGSIEIGQPTVEGAAVERFVARTGGGMHSVAVWVDDFGATLAHLEANGVGVPAQVGDPGHRFGFSSPRDTCGILFEWSEFTVEEDPRVGAELPPFTVPPLLDVTHHAFVGARVDDPAAAAERLATLLGTPIVSDGVISLGDCVLALLPFVAVKHDRTGAALLGLRVDDLAAARPVLAAAGVPITREHEGMLVLDPATTGDVAIALVDHLLPGDPRST
jgi:catechol 2,3-dioxygenase-like lactoylglutathione lyase family enzyme